MREKIKDYARIEFLQNTFGNSRGDIVKVIEETNGEVSYNDGFHRYCYLEKSEEGTIYRYIPKGERTNFTNQEKQPEEKQVNLFDNASNM